MKLIMVLKYGGSNVGGGTDDNTITNAQNSISTAYTYDVSFEYDSGIITSVIITQNK